MRTQAYSSFIGFQTSLVACISSYNCPSCSADICWQHQNWLKVAQNCLVLTFSKDVASNFFPEKRFASASCGNSSRYIFHCDRNPIICAGLVTCLCRRNSMISRESHRTSKSHVSNTNQPSRSHRPETSSLSVKIDGHAGASDTTCCKCKCIGAGKDMNSIRDRRIECRASSLHVYKI